MAVSYKDKDLQDNEEYLLKVKDVFNGTKSVKDGGVRYLSKWIYEEDENYTDRLDKSVFINFFRDAVQNTNSLLWSKGMDLTFNDKAKYFFDDVDGNGSKIDEFFMTATKKAIRDGLVYIWVDNERIDGSITRGSKVKPFLKIIERKDVISKKFDVVNGTRVLTQIVIIQSIEEEVDEYEVREVEVYVVLRQDGGKIIKADGTLVDEWTSNLDYIPVVPLYSDQTGYLQADIPFLDLAFVNIKHYNVMSEYDNILHMSAVPVQQIFTQGQAGIMADVMLEDGTVEQRETSIVGSNNALVFTDKNTEGFEFVEVSGNGISLIADRISKLEESMLRMSLTMLSADAENIKTATEAKLKDRNSSLFLVEIAKSLENCIEEVLMIAEDYTGENFSFELVIGKDFSDLKIDAQTIKQIIDLKKAGFISLESLWDALIKGEILELFDYEKEKEIIKQENAELL